MYELWQQGVVREAYFRTDVRDAVLILEASDVAEAEGRLQALPLVANGLIQFELIPLRPYTGFQRLFAGE